MMPWVDTTPPRNEAAQPWQTAIKHALLRRLSAKVIEPALQTLRERHAARPVEIASILMGFRAANGGADDPLLFGYIALCLKEKYFEPSDLLLALLKYSSYGPSTTTSPGAVPRIGMPSCEERIFSTLTQIHINSDLPTSPVTLQNLIYALWRWLKVVVDYEMGKQLEVAGLHSVDPFASGMYEALGSLTVSILGNSSIRVLSKHRWWRDRRATVVAEMQNFDVHILQWMQSQLAGRLRAITGVPPFLELDQKGRPVFTDEQILSTIPEIPVARTRAGLFIWLNAALAARPLTDDMTLLGYLHARYPDDVQTLLVDLLVATFDVLTNAILRKESNRGIRSFLCDKIPLLLTLLSGNSAQPVAPETCILMALMPGGMISMEALPPITAGATQTRDILKAARLEFLQSCALHGLLSESAVSQILQESVALPRVMKHNKDNLLAQCTNNVSRLETLFDDLDAMQGNAGAIAGCFVEHINHLCMTKDTMTLKSVCNILLRRIQKMDIIMQYTQPNMLLVPLCTVLNDWIHDQDQAEFTPSYEEFASILLLALATIHRYDLDWADFGLIADSFVAKLLDEMSLSKPVAELSPEQDSHLAEWIESIFAVDEHGEASGISDDVMRHCSPQAFYQLVPTLFEQTVLACQGKALPMKTFKGGLELLLEPFLLPSLIMGLRWLAEHSWEDHNDADILLQILEKLLKPSTNSTETRAMHAAIMLMVATPLYDSLQDLIRKHPAKKKASELSDFLKQFVGQQRTLSCRKIEIDEWIQTDGSIARRVQNGIRELIDWAAASSNPPNPPPRYAFRDFAIACQVLESEVLLDAVVTEVAQSMDMPIALDVCTTIICAPSPATMAAQPSTKATGGTSKLRNYIRLVNSDVQGLLDRKQAEAETIIRLGRRVETQLAAVAQPLSMSIPMPLPMQEQTADQIMQDMVIDLSTTSAGATVDGTMEQNASMADLEEQLNLTNSSDQELATMALNSGAMDIDQSQLFGDISMDLNQAQQNNQALDVNNQEEDIFADLQMDAGMGDMMGDLGDDFNF